MGRSSRYTVGDEFVMKWIFIERFTPHILTHTYTVLVFSRMIRCTGEYSGEFVTGAATRGGLAPVAPPAERFSSSSILIMCVVICDSRPCGLVGLSSACSCNLTAFVTTDIVSFFMLLCVSASSSQTRRSSCYSLDYTT